MYGFALNAAGTALQAAVPLSATESNATIHSGTNFVPTSQVNIDSINAAKANPGIDNPQFAISSEFIPAALVSIQTMIMVMHESEPQSILSSSKKRTLILYAQRTHTQIIHTMEYLQSM